MTIKPTTQQEDKSEPSPSFLQKVEISSSDVVSRLLGIPTGKPKAEAIAKLTSEQESQLREIEEYAIANFRGDLCQLESAMGMLRMGHHFGWRVLYLIHTKQTIRKYEDILGVKIRDVFPETGPSSYRSVGLNLAMRFNNFWKVVGGDTKIPRKKESL